MTRLIRRASIVGSGIVLTMSLLAGAAGAGQNLDGLEAEGTGSRLRGADAKAVALLWVGTARSATFRGLVQAIEQSDLVVYVETRPFLDLPGRLQLLAVTPGCRHLRVSVRVPGLDNDLVARLAHELMHAVEVATAWDVKDQPSLRRLYQRIGRAGRYGDDAESAAAQETWPRSFTRCAQAGEIPVRALSEPLRTWQSGGSHVDSTRPRARSRRDSDRLWRNSGDAHHTNANPDSSHEPQRSLPIRGSLKLDVAPDRSVG